MDTNSAIQHLSDREREILALVAKGRTNAEIGDALGLRFDTVKWYVSEILSKLGVDSREQAAHAWRSYRRPGVMASRRLRALIGLPLAKAGMGVAGAAVGGALVVVLAGSYGGDLPAWAAADATPTPTSRPWQPPDRSEYNPTGPQVDIVSTTFDQTTVTLGAFTTRAGYGFYTRYSDLAPTFMWHRGQPEPLLVGGSSGLFTVIDAAGNSVPPRPFGTLNGVVEDHITLVRVHTSNGDVIEAEPVAAPPPLDMPFKYWIAAVERVDTVIRVEALDASGQVVQSQPLYDPAGIPPPSPPPPPYEQVNFGVSGRADPSTGTVGMGTGTASFSVDGSAHEYRFGVEHDGADLPRVILWCQTGIVPIAWDPATTANGNGSFVAQVAAGNTACHWNVSADGNVRIFAMP